MNHKLFLKVMILFCLLAIASSAVEARPGQAAGVYTHTQLVEQAIERLQANGGYTELVNILTAYITDVNYGTIFPDTLCNPMVTDDWALHDTDVVRDVNYDNYLEFLDEKDYDRTNSDLQTGYYREFLKDPDFYAEFPPYRKALVEQLLESFRRNPRTVLDKQKIAFLFGLIAHQEADVPWHSAINGFKGVLHEIQTRYDWSHEEAELMVDLLFYTSDRSHEVDFDLYFNIKADILAAGQVYPGYGPTCHLPCTDALDKGNFDLEDYWILVVTNPIYWNDEQKELVENYVPGGIEHGSALVAAAWMDTWDTINRTIPYYVKPTATGRKDCSSWENACDLAYALRHPMPGQEIWMTAGVYTPLSLPGGSPTEDPRAVSFLLPPGVAFYGGFAGTETGRDQRDPVANPTILSGDIDGDDLNTDGNHIAENVSDIRGSNSYHVVRGQSGATLDGFIITGGDANGSIYPHAFGGGIFTDYSLTVKNVLFSGNRAILDGGALMNNGSITLVTNVTFAGNEAGDDGGALATTGTAPNFFNVTFSGNTAADAGGGVYNESLAANFINATFSSNTAGSGGAIYNTYSKFFISIPSIHNVILWGNSAPDGQMVNSSSAPVVSNSVIEGGYPYTGGTNIFAGDPKLGELGSYGGSTPTILLGPRSSAINKGNLAYCTSGKDQRGVPYQGPCDIGSYEYEGPADILYVKPNGEGDCTEGWDDACDLQTALAIELANSEIWVAKGVYTPGPANSPSATFRLQDGVMVYGGFPDTGYPTFADRDPAANFTILSGDIDGDDLNTDGNHIAENTSHIKGTNSYHVVTGVSNAGLDGFIITGGYADVGDVTSSCTTDMRECGGGMLNYATSSMIVANTKFIGNYADTGGGGMANLSSHVSAANVTFAGNASGNFGGGVHNSEGSSTFTTVTFQNNTAIGDGGGVDNVYFVGTFSNVTFDGNSARNGGGMINKLYSAPTLTDVTFTGNTATAKGGGMYNDRSSPALNKATFNSNTAGQEGGGMYNTGIPTAITHPTLTNVTFHANSAAQNGGAIANVTCVAAALTNVTISDNDATAGKAGALYNILNCPLTPTEVRLSNTILWGNTADDPNSQQIYILAGTNFNINDSIVQNGCPAGGSCSSLTTVDPLLGTFGSYGGSTQTIPIRAGSSAIHKGNASYCTSGTDQRGIAYVGNCDIGAYEYNYTGTYYVKESASGTADCQSWENACTLHTALDIASSGDEIWVAEGLYFPTTVMTDRTATFQLVDGVAVYGGFAGTETVRDQRDPATHVTILSGDIDHNDSQTPVITDIRTEEFNVLNSYHVVTGANSATLDGFTITAGFAVGTSPNDRGGGMYAYQKNMSLANNIFSGNAAVDGGGIYSYQGFLTATNVEFRSNKAKGSGGGLYTSVCNVTVVQSVFDGNTAIEGGGMYNSGGTQSLTDLVFTNNTAPTGHGGAIYDKAASPVLNDVTFSGNSARWGGGMHNWDGSKSTLTNVTFSGNQATETGGYGGGMSNDASILTLTNVTFNANTATTGGGGLHTINNTNVQIHNAIFWGNTAANNGAQIYNSGGNPSVVTYSVVQGGCPTGSTCNNLVASDPKLGVLGNYGGFTKTIPILPGSSAIDAGDDALCADPATVNNLDQRGITRLQGAHCDIGAYELRVYSFIIISDHGTVEVNPAQETYHERTVVQITATADAGWNFTNWSGDLTGSENPISITINSDIVIIAQFSTNYVYLYLPLIGNVSP